MQQVINCLTDISNMIEEIAEHIAKIETIEELEGLGFSIRQFKNIQSEKIYNAIVKKSRELYKKND